MELVEPEDPFNRPPITPDIKKAVAEAFSVVPPGKSSAFVGIVDQNGARVHLAWPVTKGAGVSWQVGAVVNVPLKGKPDGWVGVVGSW